MLSAKGTAQLLTLQLGVLCAPHCLVPTLFSPHSLHSEEERMLSSDTQRLDLGQVITSRGYLIALTSTTAGTVKATEPQGEPEYGRDRLEH